MPQSIAWGDILFRNEGIMVLLADVFPQCQVNYMILSAKKFLKELLST